jgi:hypothetical protein
LKATENMAESSTFPPAKEVIKNLERRYQLMMTMEPDLQLFREIHGYIKVVESTHGLHGHFLYEPYEQWHLLRAEIRRTNDIDRSSVEETLHEFYFWPIYDELWQVYGAVETFMHILEKDTKPETGRRFAMQLTDFALDGFMEQDNHFNRRKDRYKNWLRFVHPILIDACNKNLSHPNIEAIKHTRLNEEDGILQIGNHLIRLNLRTYKESGRAFRLCRPRYRCC